MNGQGDIFLTIDLRLRAILPGDHPRHLALMQRIYPPAFGYLWPDAGSWYVDRVHGPASFFREINQPAAPYYHVWFRGELIGIFRLKLHAACPDFPDEPALKLDRVYLDPAVRGLGIGTELIRFAKAETRRRGKQLLWLERMDSNEATIGFYRKNGFTDGSEFRLTMELMYEDLRGMRRLWWRVE